MVEGICVLDSSLFPFPEDWCSDSPLTLSLWKVFVESLGEFAQQTSLLLVPWFEVVDSVCLFPFDISVVRRAFILPAELGIVESLEKFL